MALLLGHSPSYLCVLQLSHSSCGLLVQIGNKMSECGTRMQKNLVFRIIPAILISPESFAPRRLHEPIHPSVAPLDKAETEMAGLSIVIRKI